MSLSYSTNEVNEMNKSWMAAALLAGGLALQGAQAEPVLAVDWNQPVGDTEAGTLQPSSAR